MPGPWKAWKTKSRLSHSFHRPLEISPRARDSHIPTARRRGHGKVENQKRVSHFPTAARVDDSCSLSRKPKTKERKSAATRPPSFSYPTFPSCRTTDFMLIFQLESAEGRRRKSATATRVFTSSSCPVVIASSSRT